MDDLHCRPTGRSLAWQILLGAVLVTLSVAILSYVDFDRERTRLEENLQLTVAAVSRAVDIELEAVGTGTAMLASSNQSLIERRDFAALQRNLSRAASKARMIDHFVLVDRSGQQWLNTQLPLGSPLPVSQNLDKYAPAFESRSPTISALAVGTVSGRQEIFLTIPVNEGEETPYVFASVVSASSFVNLLSSLNIPASWLGNIFDGQGTIVARTRDQARYVGHQVSMDLRAQLERQPVGIFEGVNLDKVRSITAYARSAGTGFGVLVSVPKHLILRQALEAQLLPGLVSALAVFSLLAAWNYGMALTHRRDTEARLLASLSNAAVGFAMTTLDGRFIDVNRAFCDLTGRSQEELRAMTFQDLIPPADLPENMALYHQLTSGERSSFVIENRFVRKDGSTVWVRKSVSMVRGDNFAPRWSFALVEDVTDRKRAVAELEDKNRALERSNADLEQFAYVASHDLQTPLRDIVHYTQMIERRYRGSLDADADDFIGFVVDGGKRMTRLINDLLEFSRVSRQLEPLYPIPAAEAVAQALRNLGQDLDRAGVEVRIGDLPVVMAELTHLISLFQNLLSNSLKYRAPERMLVLSVSAKPDRPGHWCFAVSDNGIGIEPKYHDKIFEIFQRLSAASTTDGTGIGLTLCRRIVHRFGGDIWVESTPGEGSTFFFTLADGTAAGR